MRTDPHSLALSLGFATFMIVTGIVPQITAEKPRTLQLGVRTVPVQTEDVEKLDSILKTPGAAGAASNRVTDSVSVASAVAAAQGEGGALRRAHDALVRDDYRRAEAIVDALIDKADRELEATDDESEVRRLTALRDQSLLLKSNALMQTGRAQEAVNMLDQITDANPVPDFVTYLRAENLDALGEHAEAAKHFAVVAEMTESPLTHRATVRHAHSLYDARDWEASEKAFRVVIDRYPEYPRRWLARYERGVALDRLGRLQEAADAYQATWFEFPYKKVGRESRQRLAELEKQAVVPSNLPDARARFERYRMLRINKHWDLARELFTALREDYASEDGHSSLEHEIDLQLSLNAHVQREFDEAAERLENLVSCYDAGHRAGISRYLMFKYLSLTYSSMGRLDDALAALDRMTEGYGDVSKAKARAEFYEDHGRYDKALEIYSEIFSAGRKRGWHYTWLLYKNAKFEQAYENFSRLAERSYGRNRAKYLYWAGRTLERAGKDREAIEIFAEVAENYTFNYYGLQAKNRLLDIEQRRSVAGPLVANAETIANSADEVLDALEAAADGASGFAAPASDPRAQQRHALWASNDGDVELTRGKACAPGVEDPLGLCMLKGALAKVAGSQLLDGTNDLSDLTVENDDPEGEGGIDEAARGEARVPNTPVSFGPDVPRIEYSTQARIYWNGRLGSATAFARARDGDVVGPVPTDLRAYDETDYEGALERAAEEYGHLFPELVRAYWLHTAGFEKGARWAARDVAIEYRELSKRWRARRKPHDLDVKRWSYWIDNRRGKKAGFWGYDGDEDRFPIPRSARAQRELLARQQEIHDERIEMRPLLIDALKEAGDHYMVRRFALAKKGWSRQDPQGATRPIWMEAYPRAFPKLVIHNAQKYGVNPYLLWALMTVESSYNPDSLSTADALGLLQVIPRTGLKTAIMLGDEEFGPFDLLEEDVAIEHGAFYFSQLVRKFRGQELFAIAGYNGGPHRVGDWIEMRGATMPMDEFVEEIPFNQARLYVKKVLRFLSLFLRLYESTEELYVGQNIRVDYRPDPNF